MTVTASDLTKARREWQAALDALEAAKDVAQAAGIAYSVARAHADPATLAHHDDNGGVPT